MKKAVGVQNPTIVDAVIRMPKTGEYILAMLEDRTWEGEEQLLQLEEKAQTYLEYATKGQLRSDYPDSVGNRIVVELNCAYEPSPTALDRIASIRKYLGNEAIEFRVRLLPE